MSTQVRPVGKIELPDVFEMYNKNLKINFFCHAVGTIREFNSENQTCQVEIAYKKQIQVNGQPTLSPYPLLIDCPLVMILGGDAGLTMPIKAGDDCLVLFNDRDIDNWFKGGYDDAPNTSRLHSISDGVVLAGIRNLQNSIADYDADNVHLFNDAASLKITPTKFIIENDSQNLNTVMQNILTELQNLTTQLSALTVTGVTTGPGASGVPANAAAITAIGTQLGTLATNLGELLE